MSFCNKCGQKISEGIGSCPNCGKSTSSTSRIDSTAEHQRDIDNNKLLAILAYLGILVIVPILISKDSKFTKFHSNQGLANLIMGTAYFIIISIINSLLLILSPLLSLAIMSLLSIGGIIFLAFAIIGIINAANGEMKELPVIGKIQILK